MNSLIICASITGCIYIICYYINNIVDNIIKIKNSTNSMSNDIKTIKDIINRSISIEVYNDTIKHNLLTIKHITSKYVEEPGNANTSTKER